VNVKVVCIDDFTLSGKKINGITVGKTYDGILFSGEIYRIYDDNGHTHWYGEEILMALEKYRELKLKELGI
jgi:hypothetical protein